MRSSDEAMLDLLRLAAKPILAADSETAFANLTMRFGSDEGRVRGVHFLHRRGHQVLRTSDRGRLLRATLAHLDGFLPAPTERLRLRADVLIAGDIGVIVSHSLATTLDTVGRRLERQSWKRVDAAFAEVDLTDSTIVIAEERTPLDPVGLAEIERRFPATPGAARPGARFRIAAIVVPPNDPNKTVLSPASGFATLVPLVSGDLSPTRGRDLDALRDLVAQVPVTYLADERSLPAVINGLRSTADE